MKVVAQQWVSLDGYAAGPTGEAELFEAVDGESDAASQRHNADLLPTVGQVLLGRRSYESFSAYWPQADDPVARHVNAVPKVVFSRTLDAAPWGEHEPATVRTDVVEHVRAARADGGGDLLLWGSLSLMACLVEADELDELDLFVAPVVLGDGTPLLPRGRRLALEQLSSEPLGGLTHVRHRVAR